MWKCKFLHESKVFASEAVKKGFSFAKRQLYMYFTDGTFTTTGSDYQIFLT